MNKIFRLDGKTALVTGASGGIGKEIAIKLRSMGASVVLSGRNQDKLVETAAELGDGVYTELFDLQDSESTNSFFDNAYNHTGSIDILVCNAGITKDNLVMRMSEDSFLDVMQINLFSAFVLNKLALKRMIKNRWGRIINIASVVALTGNPGQANYVASKAGLIGMTKSIAAEVAARGITVNNVAPGFITTAMTEKLKDEHKKNLLAKIPANRFGNPEEVANAVVFLASNEAAYVNGQTLHVNGGMFMS